MNRSGLSVSAFALTLLAAAPAGAQATPRDQATAQTLFEEGRRLMQAGSYPEACPKFAESNRLDPGAGTLLNLALCYEKNEQLASAWVTYTEAAADADRSGRQEWVKKGKDKAAALAPLLTTLTVLVPARTRVSGLEVTRDGQPVSRAEWGVKVPIDGGDHVIEAHAPGHEAWSTRVTAPPKSGALAIEVPPLPKAAAPVEPPPPDRGAPERAGGTQRTIGAVLAVAGVAGLGAGGFFAFRATSKHDDAKSDCNADETRCGPAGLASYDSARQSADVATIALIAGGALLIGGVVLYLTAPRGARAPTALRAPGWTF
ncbi:MAG: hypothetical protein KIT84_42885 [Labilithrix sp.]|nr:hypothetical protein [Labilithrix sp.]MCW5817825.1 hypothetical protein [Labilithrix sp.]